MRQISITVDQLVSLDADIKTPCQVELTAFIQWDQEFYVDNILIDDVYKLEGDVPVDVTALSDKDREEILDKAYAIADSELEKLEEELVNVDEEIEDALDEEFNTTEEQKETYH